ncbi:MAG: hypothetical protein JWM47_62 [Acidimicrobiales bacterium]|nr:hypothetical protein [Acidimicrobiales bacterium]
MARGTALARPPAGPEAEVTKVGPPLLLLALGFVSVLVSLPLISADGIPAHVMGYVTGGLLPILLVGFERRVDLDRRRSAYYEPVGLVPPAVVLILVLALVAAGLHIWPIATELSR